MTFPPKNLALKGEFLLYQKFKQQNVFFFFCHANSKIVNAFVKLFFTSRKNRRIHDEHYSVSKTGRAHTFCPIPWVYVGKKLLDKSMSSHLFSKNLSLTPNASLLQKSTFDTKERAFMSSQEYAIINHLNLSKLTRTIERKRTNSPSSMRKTVPISQTLMLVIYSQSTEAC